jgi:uncharacterized protein
MSDPEYTHGRMVWRELMTRDAAKARAFYAQLFGWTYEELGHGALGLYTRILLGGKPIGGLWQIAPDNPATSLWMSYVSVPDVDAAARQAVELGGKVVRGPAELPGLGRFAVLNDFAGAVIGVFRTLAGDPPLEPPKPGEFCWESLGTPGVERAKIFYGKLFGWRTTKGPEGAAARFSTEGTAQGNVADLIENKEFIPAWIPHVRVEKLGPLSDRVSELGGELTAIFSVARVGRVAIIQDPAGGQLSLYEPTSR